MLFPSSPERRHGQRRKALWKGKQYGKSIWVPPRSATTIQGFDRNSASALHIPVCITASNGVRPCRKKPYGPSATKKALLGGEPCAFRVLERGPRVEDQGDEFEIFSTVVLQHVLLAFFADHHVTGGYWLQFAIVEVQASAAEDMVHLEITDMAMPGRREQPGLSTQWLKTRPLPAKSSPLSSSAARICPLPPLCCMSNLVSSS